MGFDFFLDAFSELSTSRPSGLGIQAIPFTAIVEYFRIYELSDFDEFIYVIRRMDNVLIELSAASSAKPEGKKKNAGGNANSKNHRQG